MMPEDTEAVSSMPQPPPSEWGKINAGQAYGILAADIGRAMFCVPWKKYEMPIVFYMMEHSWGVAKTKQRGSRWPDPEPVRLNLNALATELGYPRQRLYEARDRHKAMHVLIEDVDGFWINKEVQEWIDPDARKPILSLAQLLYAGRARTRNERGEKASHGTDTDPETYKPDQSSYVTPQRDTMSHPSVTCENESTPVCHTPALHHVTPQRDTMSHPSVTSHIEERARDLDLEIEEDEEGECPPPRIDRPILNNPDDVRRATEIAEELFPLMDYGPKVYSLRTTARMDWLVAAMNSAKKSGKTRWDYILGAYRGIANDGGVKPSIVRPDSKTDPVRPRFEANDLQKQIEDFRARQLRASGQ